jgi:sterol desaturase/sphingolipid hydroxylase (fatty acid hydroxylase superfamily)
MEILGIFSAFGLSASAGLNAYIPLLAIALLAKFTNLIKLSQPWDTLTSWWIIGLILILAVVEFFADKVPAVNHINDIIQTIIRPVAGAIVFAASAHVITEIHPVLSIAAGLLVAGGVHAVKSLVVRPTVTATTGGAGNVPVSILEDFISSLISVLSVVVPVVIAAIIILLTSWAIFALLRRHRKAEMPNDY